MTVLDTYGKYKWATEKGIYVVFHIVTLNILEKDKLMRVMNNGNVKREFSFSTF